MTYEQFIENIHEGFSANKQYSHMQANRILDHLKDVSTNDLLALLNRCLDDFKYKPTPSEIKTLAQSMGLKKGRLGAIKKYPCILCNGEGRLILERTVPCDKKDKLHKRFCSELECAYKRFTVKCNCRNALLYSDSYQKYNTEMLKQNKIIKQIT